MTVAQAARYFKAHPCTIRRWIARGCPCLETGSVGRGHAATLNLEDVQRWRVQQIGADLAKRSDDEVLHLIATALMDAYRRDSIAHKVGISSRQAAGLLALAFERCWKNIRREPLRLDQLPEEITRLCAISVE